ncbi:hypothetical protein DBR21_05570, partial [Caulobacter sp. HMWF009]
MRAGRLTTVILPMIAFGSVAFAQEQTVPTAESQRIQTTSEANRDGLSGAVSAPLRDVNLLRTKIPPI